MPPDKAAYVYVLANRPHGALYVGATTDLPARISAHRKRAVPGHTARYNIDRLVHVESYPDIATARRREGVLKRWRRDWKIALIEKDNPDWLDLFGRLMS